MKRENIVGLALILVICIASLAVSAEKSTPKVIHWQVGAITAETHWSPTELRWFADELRRRTNGQLMLTVFSGGGLGYKSVDTLNAVSKNLAQMHEVWGSHAAGEVRVMELYDLPLFVPWNWDFRIKLWDALQPMYSNLLSKNYGVRPITILQAEPRAIYTKKIVTSLADLKGLKIRCSGPVETELTRSMGASPTTIDNNEQYAALQQGIIDGVWTADTTTLASKLFEVTKCIFDVKNDGSGDFILVNEQAFNELPEKTKEVFKNLEGTLTDRLRAGSLRSVTESRKALIAKGMKEVLISKSDNENLNNLSKPIIDNWVSRLDPSGKLIYNKAKVMIDQYNSSH